MTKLDRQLNEMKSLKIKLAVSIFQLYSNNYRDYLLLIKQKEKQELLELNKESLIKPKMNGLKERARCRNIKKKNLLKTNMHINIITINYQELESK